ncbi:MAG: gluconate 2-dehydrogenase subunit 3 family protein [Gammaproteobacteria bacterium]|nr:gluconate 2-dehydrogenase subunit 3 family protein [Gammaproteobacteria bacterium]
MKQHKPGSEQTRLDCGTIQDADKLSRRTFLLSGGAALTAGSVVATVPLALAQQVSAETARPGFTSHQEQILTAVTERLFPKGSESPGATDIYAVPYLERAIFRPGSASSTRNFIINRAQTLHEASMERFDLAFHQLEYSQAEVLLRYVADQTRWGANWISTLLSYILEALLSDPVYGGNPDGIGWKWLKHQPGFPRPPANKTYMNILSR